MALELPTADEERAVAARALARIREKVYHKRHLLVMRKLETVLNVWRRLSKAQADMDGILWHMFRAGGPGPEEERFFRIFNQIIMRALVSDVADFVKYMGVFRQTYDYTKGEMDDADFLLVPAEMACKFNIYTLGHLFHNQDGDAFAEHDMECFMSEMPDDMLQWVSAHRKRIERKKYVTPFLVPTAGGRWKCVPLPLSFLVQYDDERPNVLHTIMREYSLT